MASVSCSLLRHQVCRSAEVVQVSKRFYLDGKGRHGKEFGHMYPVEQLRKWKKNMGLFRKQCWREVELQERRNKFSTPQDKVFEFRKEAVLLRNLFENDLENARVAAYRVARKARLRARREEVIERNRLFAEKYHEEMTQYRTNLVKQEMAMEYISSKNADKRIHEALDNPVDFTYALHLDGSKVYSQKPAPTTTTELEDASPQLAESAGERSNQEDSLSDIEDIVFGSTGDEAPSADNLNKTASTGADGDVVFESNTAKSSGEESDDKTKEEK